MPVAKKMLLKLLWLLLVRQPIIGRVPGMRVNLVVVMAAVVVLVVLAVSAGKGGGVGVAVAAGVPPAPQSM